MPRLPQRSLRRAPLRPLAALPSLGVALAATGLVLAVSGSSAAVHATGSGTQAAGTPSFAVRTELPRPAAPVVSAPSAPTSSRGAHQPSRVTRSLQRGAWVRPVPGPVTSWFGRRWGSLHPGIDIGAPYGTPVHTITTGRIVSAGWISGYGKTVRVYSHGLVFYYPHLSRILHRHGVLRTGEVLGRVGSTGFSTGPHLHIEIRHHGRAFNPHRLLGLHGVRL